MMNGGFTAAQWVELEHQALIFKYLMAGVPVPPDLLLPIRSSLDPILSPYYRHSYSSLGYYTCYGKKMDPEPWRCRRTDGKKWRCAKEAYPDSKYCERHMHRGRNRSRKPVESSPSSNSPKAPLSSASPSPSSLTAGTPSLLTSALNPSAGARRFETASVQMDSNGLCLSGPASASSPTYLNRYSNALNPESGEHHFFSEPSGSSFSFGSTYSLMNSSYPSYLDPVHEDQLGQVVTNPKPPAHSFIGFGFGFGQDEPVKTENQLLRPFFDEWPKNRGDSWADLEDERSNRNSASFSTTRLSISIPMGSCASSPNDD